MEKLNELDDAHSASKFYNFYYFIIDLKLNLVKIGSTSSISPGSSMTSSPATSFTSSPTSSTTSSPTTSLTSSLNSSLTSSISPKIREEEKIEVIIVVEAEDIPCLLLISPNSSLQQLREAIAKHHSDEIDFDYYFTKKLG